MNKNNDANDAKSALVEYYTAIAAGKMRVAYDMLSYSMQDYMQSLQDFSQGHADVFQMTFQKLKFYLMTATK